MPLITGCPLRRGGRNERFYCRFERASEKMKRQFRSLKNFGKALVHISDVLELHVLAAVRKSLKNITEMTLHLRPVRNFK